MKNKNSYIITLIQTDNDSYGGVCVLISKDNTSTIEKFNTNNICIDFIDALIFYISNSKATDQLIISEAIYKYAKENNYNVISFDNRYGCEIVAPKNIETSEQMQDYYVNIKKKQKSNEKK